MNPEDYEAFSYPELSASGYTTIAAVRRMITDCGHYINLIDKGFDDLEALVIIWNMA